MPNGVWSGGSTTRTSTTTTSAPKQPPPYHDSSSTLTTPAQIGIGIGVGVGVFALAGILVLTLCLRHRRRHPPRAETSNNNKPLPRTPPHTSTGSASPYPTPTSQSYFPPAAHHGPPALVHEAGRSPYEEEQVRKALTPRPVELEAAVHVPEMEARWPGPESWVKTSVSGPITPKRSYKGRRGSDGSVWI